MYNVPSLTVICITVVYSSQVFAIISEKVHVSSSTCKVYMQLISGFIHFLIEIKLFSALLGAMHFVHVYLWQCYMHVPIL